MGCAFAIYPAAIGEIKVKYPKLNTSNIVDLSEVVLSYPQPRLPVPHGRSRTFFGALSSAFVVAISAFLASGCQTTWSDQQQAASQRDISRSVQSVAVSLLNRGQPDLALKELRPYHQEHPKDSEVINLMGLCHLALGQPRRAEQHFSRSYGLKKDPAVALNLSSAYLQQQRWRKAVTVLKSLEAKTRYPHPERVYHNLAAAYEKQGRSQLSRRTYDKALKVHSSYVPSLVAKARLNMRLGRYPMESWRLITKAEKSCARCFQPVLLKSLWLNRHRGRKEALRAVDEFAASRAATGKTRLMAERLKKKLQSLPQQGVVAAKSLPKTQKKE